MKYKTIIVEDSKYALQRLVRFLSEFQCIDIVGKAKNGEKAIKIIKDKRPDIVFLDIELGSMTGFEIINEISFKAFIIFITGHKEYAVDAFEINSVDYLIKPINKQRLSKSIERVKRLSKKSIKSNQKEDVKDSFKNNIFVISFNNNYKFIDKEDVIYFQSKNNIIYLYIEDKSYMYDSTLKDLEKKLNNEKFERIHKRTIVNIN